jgi:predicted ATP-grasp superfamily ATP-dependent carboligase
MSDTPPLLIASLSARSLTRSARRGGYRVLALDCFADVDTCKAAAAVSAIPFDSAGGFQVDAFLREADKLAAREPLAGIVYGSGFEERPELLAGLADKHCLYGNSPETVLRVKKPLHWAATLESLGLKCPGTSSVPPVQPNGWLAKRQGASGGWHVRSAAGAPGGDGWFYQRRIEGPVYSVLFLADGCNAVVIGFNRQWTYGDMGGSGFAYAGAVGNPELPQSVRDEVTSAVSRLSSIFELRGLNGIDFVLARDARPYLLELNPRPTATVDLWDEDWADGLVAAHIAACRGELPGRVPQSARVRGHAIVYAKSALAVSDEWPLPQWCRDVPRIGSRVQAGEPICSVFAEGPDSETAEALLRFRRDLIQRSLSGARASGPQYARATEAGRVERQKLRA